MSPPIAPATERRLNQVIDIGERLLLIILFASLVLRVSHSLATNPFNALLLVSDGLVVVFILIRRSEALVTKRPMDWIAGVLGTMLPLLVRPGGVSFVPVPVVAALMAAGVLLGFWSKLTLQRSFGIAAANRGVVTTGPYRLIRHPIYAGYLLVHIGFALANPLIWNVSIYLATLVFQIFRIFAEEKLLALDPAYAAMQDKVRYRLVPGLF